MWSLLEWFLLRVLFIRGQNKLLTDLNDSQKENDKLKAEALALGHTVIVARLVEESKKFNEMIDADYATPAPRAIEAPRKPAAAAITAAPAPVEALAPNPDSPAQPLAKRGRGRPPKNKDPLAG
jgi:hypothetical protein